jgi:hypothetical protein
MSPALLESERTHSDSSCGSPISCSDVDSTALEANLSSKGSANEVTDFVAGAACKEALLMNAHHCT